MSQWPCHADVGTGSWYPLERVTPGYFGTGHAHVPFALTSQLLLANNNRHGPGMVTTLLHYLHLHLYLLPQMQCSVMPWCFVSSFWGMPGVKQELTCIPFHFKTAFTRHSPFSFLQICKVTECSGDSAQCLRHPPSRLCQEENLQEAGHVLQARRTDDFWQQFCDP